MQELTEMLGFRPYRFYYYMWKFVSPLCMAVLTTASIIQLGLTPPGYSAWIKEEVKSGAAEALGLGGADWQLLKPQCDRGKGRTAARRQVLPDTLCT